MDDIHRKIAEDLFVKMSIALTENKAIPPLYAAITPENELIPIMLAKNVEVDFSVYSSLAVRAATELKATGMMLVSVQYLITKDKDDPSILSLMSGEIRASEHPDSVENLILTYMSQHGETETLIAEVKKDPSGTPYTVDQKWLKVSESNLMIPWAEDDVCMQPV